MRLCDRCASREPGQLPIVNPTAYGPCDKCGTTNVLKVLPGFPKRDTPPGEAEHREEIQATIMAFKMAGEAKIIELLAARPDLGLEDIQVSPMELEPVEGEPGKFMLSARVEIK